MMENIFSYLKIKKVMGLKTPIVIELGSGYIRAGFSGENEPRITFPTNTFSPNPMPRGVVTNWDDLRKIIGEIYTQLNVNPSEHAVLITEPPLNPKANREKMAQIMFDDFAVPAMYVIPNALLALYATGRNTGLVVHSEEGISHVVSIYEGYVLPHAIIRLDLAQRDLTDYLVQLLSAKGYNISTPAERLQVQKMLTDVGCVALNYEEDLAQAVNRSCSYTTSSGHQITYSNEDFKAVEAMFQPALIGMDSAGIHETVYNAVMKCDVDIRKDLYANLVLAGDNVTYSGISDRMHKEVSALAPPTMKVKIIAPPEAKIAVWIGGAIITALSVFSKMWITAAEYAESGPSIIHRKSM